MSDDRIRKLRELQKEVELAEKRLNDFMFGCIDCGINTNRIGEYYVVSDSVWAEAIGNPSPDGLDGMLCIGCLEKRIGRRLRPCDFERDLGPYSPRLNQRMGKRNTRQRRQPNRFAQPEG
jgi:hypothetical protein